MSKCMVNNWHLLRYLSDENSNTKLVTIILKHSDKELLNSLTEIFFNLANGVPVLEKKTYNKLKVLFGKLADRNVSAKTKKAILVRTRKYWLQPVKRALDTFASLCQDGPDLPR